MSIVVRFSPTNVTTEKYEETIRRLKEAGSGFLRTASTTTFLRVGGEPARQRDLGLSGAAGGVGERLMPILADVGIEFSGEPEIFEVHNIVKR